MADDDRRKKTRIRVKTGQRHRFVTRRPWLDVLVVVVSAAGKPRKIKPHGSTRVFDTDEIVWSENLNVILSQIRAAEKIWGIEFLHHGSPITEKSFMFVGDKEFPVAQGLREYEFMRDYQAEAINTMFGTDADSVHSGQRDSLYGARAMLIYTSVHPDMYSKIDGKPRRGGVTVKRAEHPELNPQLPTDVAFIFSDRIIAKEDGPTTAHELGHLVGDLPDVSNKQNLMGPSANGGDVSKDQVNKFLLNGRKKRFLRYGPKPPPDSER